jgi:hypothetical protein
MKEKCLLYVCFCVSNVALAFPSGPIQKLYTCNAPWDHLFLHTLVLETAMPTA